MSLNELISLAACFLPLGLYFYIQYLIEPTAFKNRNSAQKRASSKKEKLLTQKTSTV